jgi:putative nucleotidyltransferase with HDIG domain
VLLGTAFSTMGALLAIHGAATPGMLVGVNGVIAFAGAGSIPAGAAILALSAGRRTPRLRTLLALQVAAAVLVGTLGTLGLLVPSAVPAVPQARSAPAIVLLVIGILLLAVPTVRAARTHALTGRSADLLVAAGCLWLAVALVPQLLGGPMTVGFYFGHGLELGGMALVGIPAALDVLRARASRPLLGDLTAPELVAAEEAYLGPRVRALLVKLAERDGSTEEHTRRVALLAAQVAEELKLPATARRHLAIGGLLHDIGKLAVPIDVLRKPGRLEAAEFEAIKRHPEAGRRLLDQLGGFPRAVKHLVRDHHERLDGSGYPAGVTADELGLETRILAVCDVYDALVSDRVYRNAWSQERALALLRSEAGTKHDERAVAALERVVGEPGWVAALAPAAPATAAELIRATRRAR